LHIYNFIACSLLHSELNKPIFESAGILRYNIENSDINTPLLEELNQKACGSHRETPDEICNQRKEMSVMAENLKKIECDPTCGFMVRSHDEKELIDLVSRHAKNSHNMTVSEKDLREKMKDA
jgi:predicted small metal-binding protein